MAGSTIAMLVTVFSSGVIFTLNCGPRQVSERLDNTSNDYTPSRENITREVWSDQYRIQVIDENDPSMEGLNGFTYSADDYTIYLRTGQTAEETYTTCVHEKLHNLGIGEDEHYWINKNEAEIVDGTCLKMLYKLRPGDLKSN